MKRRDFVVNSTLASIGGLSVLRSKMEHLLDRKDIGVQLYTVRDAMAKDPITTLKAISSMGFTHVENAGYKEGKYYGMSRSEFKSLLSDLNLKMYSGHIKTGADDPSRTHTMTNMWGKACEDAAAMDQKTIALAYIHDFERTQSDDYKKLAELCNKCGEIARSFGVELSYHNHDFEFYKMDGLIPYDILLEEVDANNMSFEIDLYWTAKANVEATDYFERYPGRFPLWHIKDMEDSEEQFFTEVGNGVIDWKKYFSYQEKAGLKHFYVEQDHCKNHLPLESIKISLDYLQKINTK